MLKTYGPSLAHKHERASAEEGGSTYALRLANTHALRLANKRSTNVLPPSCSQDAAHALLYFIPAARRL
jgi:hypothetical protein